MMQAEVVEHGGADRCTCCAHMTLYTRAASARATCNPRIDARWYKNACSTTCRGTAVREAQQAHCLGCRVFAEHGHRMSDHLLDHHLPTVRACRPGLRL